VSLNVALVPGPDQVVVRFTGDADLSTSPVITEALGRAAMLGTRQVVVDVATTKFWDLSGLHALVAFSAELTAADRSCRLVGALAGTRRLIGLADLADHLVLDGAVPARPSRPVGRPRPGAAARRPTSACPAPARGGQPAVAAGRLSHRDDA
jgi:anti-anti-sigma factor